MRFKIYLITLFIIFKVTIAKSQNYWHDEASPTNYTLARFSLDTAAFFSALFNNQPIILPLPGTSSQSMLFKKRSNFSAELSAKYPAIQSYISEGTEATIYLDYYAGMIHVFKLDPSKAYFILPDKTAGNTYILTSDSIQSANREFHPLHCLTQGMTKDLTRFQEGALRNRLSGPIRKRTYRMALAVTGEYSALYGNSKEKILAGLNTEMTRINAVYAQELGVDFKLIPNNDTLIFLDANSDPYSNGDLAAMISQNSEAINFGIGLSNYDIGHVFGTNSGGLAQLSSVCTGNKGAGASSPFGAYSETNFYLIPCHEIGHQLGAEHIFNLCDNQNENTNSAYEPGSGSTIMSYAGASNCGPNYIQELSDPYFHSYSIQQMKTFTRNGIGSLCGELQVFVQTEPSAKISSPSGSFIPIQTPFELEGMATDDNLTGLTFTWEELDLGPKSVLGKPTGTAPLFRSIPPTRSAVRSFPSLVNILNNQNDIREVLPSTTRPLNFRFLVRDNDPIGATDWADIALQSIKTAGPFKITAFNTKATLFKNDLIYVTWDIAQTNTAPIACKKVTLYWSTDGGLTFNYILAKDTDNDGGEWITIPNLSTEKARIKLKASENVFFDINDTDLKVLDQLNPTISIGTPNDLITLCEGQGTEVLIRSSTSSNMDTIIFLDNLSNPFLKIQYSKLQLGKSDSLRVRIQSVTNSSNDTKSITLKGINSRTKDTVLLNLKINLIRNNEEYLFPAMNQDQVNPNTAFKWTYQPETNVYIFELSENPSFKSISYSKKLELTDTVAIPETTLKTNQLYFWRVRPLDYCTTIGVPFAVFHTQSIACKTYKPIDLPKFISATGTPRVSSVINVKDTFKLSQISLPVIQGTHDFIGDLVLTLKAPTGDSILLWSRQCNNLSNFNLGLDDQSVLPITCPLTDRKLHKPDQSFNNLLGSPTIGNWSLQIYDANSGSGGSLDDWSLQLCGSVSGNGPKIISNTGIKLFEFTNKIVSSKELKTQDVDTDDQQIKFILLQAPTLGYFIKNQTDTLAIGSSFFQADINTGRIAFSALGVRQDTLEKINFLLIDENNNWLSNQALLITILNDVTIKTETKNKAHLLLAYPNPSSDRLILENLGDQVLKVQLYSYTGILKDQFSIATQSRLDYKKRLPPGIYFLKYSVNPSSFRILKIVVVAE